MYPPRDVAPRGQGSLCPLLEWDQHPSGPLAFCGLSPCPGHSVRGQGRVKLEQQLAPYVLHLNTLRCAKSLQSYLTLCNPIDHSPPGSSVHGILQAKYWSGLPCPPPGDLPDPGIEYMSLWLLHCRQILYC